MIDYTSFENDDLMVFAEGNGQLEYEQKHVYAGSERILQFTDKGDWERILYVHEDVMGNTRYYTKANGQSFAELTYDAWGMPESPNKLLNNDHGNYVFATFTGHIYDTTLDIYFAEARFYDANNRTWLAIDPIKDGGNWYQYCYGDPINYFDPDGEMGIIIAGYAGVLLTGAAAGNVAGGIVGATYGIIVEVTDEEEGIDAEGLTKYEEACKALNVSLKETKNGITSLRNPMEVLKELSIEYSKLDSNDIRRTNLLNSVGGKLRANALNALLENYDMYSQMLEQYAQGTGSMAAEAEKTANSWEGSMNRLSNTWTDTVQNVADSDAIITAINGLNGILSAVNNITEALGSWGTIGAGIGIAASFKNVGRDKMYSLIC